MGFSCGIVGLPNVGKSTLFNAITKSNIDAANYPFCTIEPNQGVVSVPDPRLNRLAEINSSQKIIPAVVEFIDIAGLVAGASKGEGLGNKFLGHIREVDAICHVVRLFSDPNVTHVKEADPISDLEIIFTELILADLESLEKRKNLLEKQTRSGNKEALKKVFFIEELIKSLSEGHIIQSLDLSSKEEIELLLLKELQLITAKPFLIIGNVNESQVGSYQNDSLFQSFASYCQKNNFSLITLSAKFENELRELDEASAKELLTSEGLKESGLDRLIVEGYHLLDLITFFTSGEKETRAWTIKNGSKAPQAAGKIHTDFEKGFIKAETVSFEDLTNDGSYHKCRELGNVRIEGKEYLAKDGDVFVFRFNT